MRPVTDSSDKAKRKRERYASDPIYRKHVRTLSQTNRALHREKINAHKRNRPVEIRLFESAKQRAKDRNLPFTIALADIIVPAVCPIDRLPLLRTNSKGPNPRSPTLDAVIPELGYVPGNIAVISFHWNRLKCTMGVGDLRRLIEYIEGHDHAATAI